VFSLLHHVLKAFAYSNPHHVKSHTCVVNFGLVALNIDGIAFLKSNSRGFGGIICDHTTSFMHGFLDNINIPCVLHSKIVGLYHGLKLCCVSDYKHVFSLT